MDFNSIIAKRVRDKDPQGYGIIAQLGEHLPYKQRVIGSSPIGPITFHLAVRCILNRIWRDSSVG